MQMHGDDELIKIDVAGVLKERVPRLSRYIPRGLVRRLERLICQDRLNGLLEENHGRIGADFCRGVLDSLEVSYRVEDEQRLPSRDDSRMTFVCNHPLGALDGICIIDMLAQRYGPNLHFVVNDLLMAVRPLQSVFVPINKHGAQSRQQVTSLDEAFRGERPVIVFPAGLVSRRDKQGVIADLRWHKMFVNKCIEHGRDVVPLHFDARNSSKFYKFANLRTRLGLKFNLEMLLLPSEIFKCEGSKFSIRVGERISWRRLRGGVKAQEQADEIRREVYMLKHSHSV